MPWTRRNEVVEPFGRRTTWKRFENMQLEESMLQTSDVDLAFQTTGGHSYCFGGEFMDGISCPNE